MALRVWQSCYEATRPSQYSTSPLIASRTTAPRPWQRHSAFTTLISRSEFYKSWCGLPRLCNSKGWDFNNFIANPVQWETRSAPNSLARLKRNKMHWACGHFSVRHGIQISMEAILASTCHSALTAEMTGLGGKLVWTMTYLHWRHYLHEQNWTATRCCSSQ